MAEMGHDGTHVEDEDAPEDTAHGLGHIAARARGLGGSTARDDVSAVVHRMKLQMGWCIHSDELHALERERGLDKHRQDAEELVERRVLRSETCTVQRPRVLPVLRIIS